MLDKAIEHGKEHRKPYRGAKACDKACRNHGSDDWARDNRLYRANRLTEKAEQDIDDIDFSPEHPTIKVTVEVVNVSVFEPEFDDIEVIDEI